MVSWFMGLPDGRPVPFTSVSGVLGVANGVGYPCWFCVRAAAPTVQLASLALRLQRGFVLFFRTHAWYARSVLLVRQRLR